MNIIITGAMGFIGKNLAERLHGEGVDITATGRKSEIGGELKGSGIRFIPADIIAPLSDDFPQADCLIHCASKTADWGNYRDFYAVNVLGTQHVIDLCKRKKIGRIIFVSTASIYYSGRDRFNVREDDKLPVGQSNYGKTKIMAENKLMAHHHDGIKVIILRPRAVCGKQDGILISRILQLSRRRNVPLINQGKALIDITSLENFVGTVKCCLAAPEGAWNAVYNISNGSSISVRELYAKVFKIVGRPFNPVSIPLIVARFIATVLDAANSLPLGNKHPLITRYSVGYMGTSLTMSIEKARRDLGFVPIVSPLYG